jgi:hypothetical protein
MDRLGTIPIGIKIILGAIVSINTFNADIANAQMTISHSKQQSLSPAQQMMMETQQGSAPQVGGGSMHILRFSANQLSFAPLDGINRVLNWRTNEDSLKPKQNLGSLVDQFKQQQKQRVIADGEIFRAINRLKKTSGS